MSEMQVDERKPGSKKMCEMTVDERGERVLAAVEIIWEKQR